MSATAAPVVLLGAQRFEPTLRSVADGLGLGERIALVTAGWQEREEEDGELVEHLGRKTVNLRIYERTEDIFQRDRALHDAHRQRQLLLRRRQDFYRIRLEHLLEAAHAIRTRSAEPGLAAEEEEASAGFLRTLDAGHLDACARIRAEFDERYDTHGRAAVAEHREQIAELLQGSDGIAISGGNVGVLLSRLHLLGFGDLCADHPLLAWSAGAMVLAERVVLYHDFPPQGHGDPQVLDRGLGLAPGVVVLPNPETRLDAQNQDRIGELARRFAPDRCVAFPARSHITLRGRAVLEAEAALLLGKDGSVEPVSDGTSW